MAYKRRDIERLVLCLEEQGCKARPSKSGFVLVLPNNELLQVHGSISDSQRGLKNQRAKVRRAGLVWPDWFKV